VALLAEISMPDLQPYPWNLNLIKIVKDNDLKSGFVNFSDFCFLQKIRKWYLQRNHKWK